MLFPEEVRLGAPSVFDESDSSCRLLQFVIAKKKEVGAPSPFGRLKFWVPSPFGAHSRDGMEKSLSHV